MKQPLIAVEYNGIEVDYCVLCGGIWLDQGELELLLGGAAANRFLGAMREGAQVREQTRRCPICRGAMNKAQTEATPPVLYDCCGRGHGLWFDRHELKLFMQQSAAAPGSEAVARWLNDLFPEETPHS
ncbi:MAG: zf-TFIIB domain-containing protein [Candidatus Hydrogenedentes bacterium]|nr:zf-TFIIB domain-containing protein [Candidatus Hydrogenedentota bacterium]